MYNKRNCQSCIRQTIVLDTGAESVKIVIAGQYAFKWSITVIKRNGIQSLVFQNRKQCLAELQRAKTQYRLNGTVRLAI